MRYNSQLLKAEKRLKLLIRVSQGTNCRNTIKFTAMKHNFARPYNIVIALPRSDSNNRLYFIPCPRDLQRDLATHSTEPSNRAFCRSLLRPRISDLYIQLACPISLPLHIVARLLT